MDENYWYRAHVLRLQISIWDQIVVTSVSALVLSWSKLWSLLVPAAAASSLVNASLIASSSYWTCSHPHSSLSTQWCISHTLITIYSSPEIFVTARHSSVPMFSHASSSKYFENWHQSQNYLTDRNFMVEKTCLLWKCHLDIEYQTLR